MSEVATKRAPMHTLESFGDRPLVDQIHLDSLQAVRRTLGQTMYELDAVETLNAAASALEHPQPQMDTTLARKLRLSVNVLLYLARFNSELISEINELDGSYARAETDAEADASTVTPKHLPSEEDK